MCICCVSSFILGLKLVSALKCIVWGPQCRDRSSALGTEQYIRLSEASELVKSRSINDLIGKIME